MEASNTAADGLLIRGQQTLQQLLGAEWEVTADTEAHTAGDSGIDATFNIKSGDGVFVPILVTAKWRLTPKDVAAVLGPRADLVRSVNRFAQLMVLAPWISPMSQQALRDRGIAYMDLTGNVSMRVSRPAIVIEMQGEQRAPAGYRQPAGKPLLTGVKAGRLIRLLTDVRPPYRATDLAKHSGLSLPYVSRLLDSLEDQLLISRTGKMVTGVAWEQLIRARAQQTDLLRSAEHVGMLAPHGVLAVLDHLQGLYTNMPGQPREVIMTGSYAARSFAPVSVGGQLMLYVQEHPLNVDRVAEELGLLPVPEGADVLLLRAKDRSVFERPIKIADIWQVAPSQLAMDCLSGPGRMPAEGEAVLEFMSKHEASWRKTDLSQAQQPSLF